MSGLQLNPQEYLIAVTPASIGRFLSLQALDARLSEQPEIQKKSSLIRRRVKLLSASEMIKSVLLVA